MPEESLLEVEAMYRDEGFTESFRALADRMVHCGACKSAEPAEQTPMLALHRFEGDSDPSDESIIAALECAACGAWGTMVLTYGPEAEPKDHEVLGALMDRRDASPITPGQ